MFYDTHCHLDYYLQATDSNKLSAEDVSTLSIIIEKCKENKVEYINTICVEIDKFQKIYNISNTFDKVYCSIGQHPLYTFGKDIEFLLTKMISEIEADIGTKNKIVAKIVAIGECGLDFFKINDTVDNNIDHNTVKRNQINFFERQIEIGKKFKLPIIIHTRNAEDETYDIIKNSGHYSGVLHSFTGSKEFMKKMLDLGFFVSFSGIVTFKNAKEIQDNLKYCPLDRLLIETDSPYLSPEPIRGRKNFPENVVYIFNFIENILQESKNTKSNLKEILLQNSKKVFNPFR